MTRLAMGGTFDVLHRGHRALIDTAFEAADEGVVVIGVTTDEFANAERERPVRPWAQRVDALKAFLAARGYLVRASIVPIDSAFGFALEPQYDGIAATAETVAAAERINEERARLGLDSLRVVLAPYVFADDGEPIRATRIRNGEIDREGRLLHSD